MNYILTVAAVLASGIHWRGSTEFDKAAVFLNANGASSLAAV